MPLRRVQQGNTRFEHVIDGLARYAKLLDYDTQSISDIPVVDIRPLRELFLKEMKISKERPEKVFQDVDWVESKSVPRLLEQPQTDNYISSVLYALSSVNCFQKILEAVYIHCLECIKYTNQLPVPNFIYYLARTVFHLRRETMQNSYFQDLVDSINTNLSNFMTYSFVDVYVGPPQSRNSSSSSSPASTTIPSI